MPEPAPRTSEALVLHALPPAQTLASAHTPTESNDFRTPKNRPNRQKSASHPYIQAFLVYLGLQGRSYRAAVRGFQTAQNTRQSAFPFLPACRTSLHLPPFKRPFLSVNPDYFRTYIKSPQLLTAASLQIPLP